MSDSLSTVSVHWHCGHYVGGYQYFDWAEPDDCSARWDTEEDAEEYAARSCSSECPECGALCRQKDGHAELIK